MKLLIGHRAECVSSAFSIKNMSARNRHGIGTAQKSALSDNQEEESTDQSQKHAVPGNINSRKVSQKPPVNTKQGKNTPSTDDRAKTENDEKEKESIKPTVSGFSKQGQWPGYLTTSIMIVLGILLYHFLYIQRLSTVSEENIESNLERFVKKHGSKFEEILKREIGEVRTSHLNSLERDINTTKESQIQLSADTHKLEIKVEKNVKEVLSQETRLKQFETDIKEAKENLKTIQAESIRAIDGNVTKVMSSIEHWNKSLNALNESYSEISCQTEETKNSLKQLQLIIKQIKQENDVQTENYYSLKRNVEATKQYLEIQLDTANENFTNLNNSLAIADSHMKQNQHLTDDVRSLMTTYTEKVEPNLFNKGHFLVAFMLLFVLVLITMISQYRLYQRMEGVEAVEGGRSRNQSNRFQSSTDILRQVPSKPQLQAAVCIISFDEGRQAAHQQLLDSANLPNCRVVTFVVGRHANIPDLPKCKVFLMCTEFSERHVIIEEQGLGLGDLHRTTYDAVLKLGGQLIILYTRDPGSRRLKDDEVFNKNIYCVTNQKELVELNNMGRFFSVYDTLTAQQKTKLRKTIMDCLQ